jgi:hypothetical protein
VQTGTAAPALDHAWDEYRVLLQCVRHALQLDPEPRAVPSAGFAWPRLIALADRHDVIPLLNAALGDSVSVPAQVRPLLRSHCRTVIAHNLSLASELAELVELFERSGVHAIPFKGPAWTKALYGNLAYRQIRDLDIFVDRSEVARACGLLSERGYVLSKRLEAMPIAQCKDIELRHPGRGFYLELHWSACEPWHDRRVSRLMLWNPASSTILLNRRMPLPSAENVFFLLAIHGARHRWESLKWLCDIAAALHAFPDLDWGMVLSQAGKISRRRIVLLPLALVNQLFQVHLPPSVATAIERDTAVARLAAYIQWRHYASGAHDPGRGTAIGRLIYCEGMRFRMRESLVERFCLLAGFLFREIKPNANDRQRVGQRWLPEPLYWLLRPCRLVRIYGPAAILKFARQLFGPTEAGPSAPRHGLNSVE